MSYQSKAIKIATILAICLFVISSTGYSTDADPIQEVQVIKNITSMPLAFTQNNGQWDDQVLFCANAGRATMWFTKDGATYQFTRSISNDKNAGAQPFMVGLERYDHQPDSIESISIKASFVGANPNPQMVGSEMIEYKCNYFIGNEPNEWHTDVPNYNMIIYEEIYSGIDLKYYGNGKQMEYDFIVSPGADPSQIAIQYDGAKSLSVNADGELVVGTEWGEVIEQRPVVYQLQNGIREPITGEYVLAGNNKFGFSLDSNYNPALPLVIDPILSYSTYLGGVGYYDYGYGISVDIGGNAYVTGYTYATEFPTENPYQTDQGDVDAFVTKLSSAGGSLIYSTYLGGGSYDYGYSISVDIEGNAYVTGNTNSTDFPTENPYQTDYQWGGNDAFVTKLSSVGNSLIYSTYLGGGGGDAGNGISVDIDGHAYVTGYTNSTDFPTENPYQTDQGDSDAFVTKLSSAGSSLIYSTYLGGGNVDDGRGISVDASGNAYVTGNTSSTDFPTENPYQTDQGGTDAFVTKLSNTGSSLIYSTYLGGGVGGGDHGYGISVDIEGNAYVTGTTWSTNFPTENPYQTDQAYADAFVTKLSSAGSSLIYSTYLGGGSNDRGHGISVDIEGNAYVTGFTESTDFPTENPYQTDQGSADVFVTKLSSTGESLIYSTYLGGGSDDYGYGISVDGSGIAYITGETISTDFPTENPYQTCQGGVDVFVSKFSFPNCCLDWGIVGDANKDGIFNLSDILNCISYVYIEPTEEPQAADGCNALYDADGDGESADNPHINLTDILNMIANIYIEPTGSPIICCPPGCVVP